MTQNPASSNIALSSVEDSRTEHILKQNNIIILY